MANMIHTTATLQCYEQVASLVPGTKHKKAIEKKTNNAQQMVMPLVSCLPAKSRDAKIVCLHIWLTAPL